MKWFLAGIVAVGISNASARSQMKIPTDPMRVSRLLERAEMFVKDYPKDPAGVRVLGDIHAYAFEHRAFYLNSHWSTQFRKDRPPSVYSAVPESGGVVAEAWIRTLEKMKVKKQPDDILAFATARKKEEVALQTSGWQAAVMTPGQELGHFRSACANYEKMIAMPATHVPHHAGEGSLVLARLWQKFSLPERHQAYGGLKDVPAPKSAAELAALFYRAYELTHAEGLRQVKEREREQLHWIPAYDAGTHYLQFAPAGEHAEEVRKYLEAMLSAAK